MFRPIEKDEDYLNNKLFVGIVEDNIDKNRKGRIKVRVQGVFNEIELEHIPWASPFEKGNGTSFKIPAVGKVVNVIFPLGNIYTPEYIYTENYNINLQQKLKGLNDEEYKNFVALLFDHRTQVYSDDSALNLDYFDNVIRLTKNTIDVKLKDNKQLLNLGDSSCDQDAVLGTNFFRWFDSFMVLLAQPETLTGNLLAPILRPTLDEKIKEYQALRSTFVSNVVKIVDNKIIIKDQYDSSRLNSPMKDDTTDINKNKILTPSPEPSVKKLQENVKSDREKNTEETVKSEPIINAIIITGSTENKIVQTATHDSYLNNFPYDEQIKVYNDNEKKIDDLSKIDPYDNYWLNNKDSNDRPGIISRTETYGVYKTYPSNNQILNDPYADFWTNEEYIIENNSPTAETYISDTTISDTFSIEENIEDGIFSNILVTDKGLIQWAIDTAKWANSAVPTYSIKAIGTQKITSSNLLKPYTSGVHGLCAVGSWCHAHTLLGTPMLWNGNAEDYSFNGKKKSVREMTKSGGIYLYEDIKKPQKEYFVTPKKWQLGDIICYAYDPMFPCGHIQIYLGKDWGWFSDFKQGHVINNNYSYTIRKPKGPALWRLTAEGLKIANENLKKYS